MNTRIALGAAFAATAAFVSGQPAQRCAAESGGPDVAVCALSAATSFLPVGDIHPFAVGTLHSNVGDESLLWQQATANHPVIAQNMYRYKDGRFEQIGMSWVVHGFCALQQSSGCGVCEGVAGCPQFLLAGCSDVHGTTVNGLQTIMGPRSDVNPSTGAFPYPYTIGFNQSGDSTYKRLQVHYDDLDPALNEGAVYYLEAHFIHPQEGTSDHRHNNASHRPFDLSFNADQNTWSLIAGAPTSQFLPAIYAWQALDPLVTIEIVDIPGTPEDGRFHLGYRVTDNGDGTWRYDYALHNFNSHRAAQAFSVPLAENVNVVSTYHRDVKYHSGEVYTNEDWTLEVSDGAVTWTGEPFSKNEHANALRWGTTFNFALVADTPPMQGEISIAMFQPGTIGTILVDALVPDSRRVPVCTGDLNASGAVDVLDLLELLATWGTCENCPADFDANGEVNVLDLLVLLAHWGPCP